MNRSYLFPLFLFASAVLLFYPSQAVTGEPFGGELVWTVEDVKKIAVERNPDIKSALANYDAALKGIVVASSKELPRVDLATNFQETTLPSPSAGLSNNLGKGLPYGSVVAGINQIAYDFGKTLNEIAVGKVLGNAAEQRAEAVRLAVILGVEKGFYEVSNAEEQVAVAGQGVAELEETRRRIDAMVRAKARPGFDLSQANVELSKAKLTLIKVSNNRDAAKIFLLNILGLPAYTKFKLTPVDRIRLVDVDKLDVEKLTKTAMEKRPELKTREFAMDAAKAGVLREEGNYLPTLSVGGWLGQYYFNYPGAIDNAWGAGVALEWNLFEGFATRGRVGVLTAKLNEESAELEKQKLSVSAEVANGVIRLKEQGSVLSVAGENLENATENSRLAKLRYEAGVATFLELLTAETNLLEAKARAVQARYQYEVAVAILITAVGGPVE